MNNRKNVKKPQKLVREHKVTMRKSITKLDKSRGKYIISVNGKPNAAASTKKEAQKKVSDQKKAYKIHQDRNRYLKRENME